MHIWKRRFSGGLGVACVVVFAGLAVSQSALAEGGKPLLQQLWGDRTEIDIGVGVAGLSRYVGSKEDKLVLAPTLSIYRGAFFLDSIRGLGVEYLHDSGVYASLAWSYDLGREERNSTWRPGSSKLRGMGRVAGASTLNLLGAVPLGNWLSVNVEADIRVAGAERGNRYRAALEATALEDDDDLLTFGAHVHGGSRRYNQTFFGVTPSQAATSRFEAFAPRSGVHGYALAVDWHHQFDRRWTLSMGLKALRLSERAKASPVIEQRNDVNGFASLHYRF